MAKVRHGDSILASTNRPRASKARQGCGTSHARAARQCQHFHNSPQRPRLVRKQGVRQSCLQGRFAPAAGAIGGWGGSATALPRLLVTQLATALIKGYQWSLALLLGPRCRFYPSCSEYTLQAIKRFGLAKGGWLGAKRICKCHPLNPGGVDLVPELAECHNVAPPPPTLRVGELPAFSQAAGAGGSGK